jgi:hypothetical protein
MVHNAHLFVLQIHSSSFGADGEEKWCCFSQCAMASGGFPQARGP